MKPEIRREAVAIAVGISPFAVLAAAGALFDLRILSGVLLFVPPAALGAASYAFFVIRFRHVNREGLYPIRHIPGRLILARALLPIVAFVIFCAFVYFADPAGGRLPLRVFAAAAAFAFACWGAFMFVWRRWARSLGLDPDIALVSINHAHAGPRNAAGQGTSGPPAV